MNEPLSKRARPTRPCRAFFPPIRPIRRASSSWAAVHHQPPVFFPFPKPEELTLVQTHNAIGVNNFV